jgi:hypothetical protein
MDTRDIELIKKLAETDAELSALWDDHVAYGKMIEKLESKPYLNPAEDKEVKELKKKKLAGKTRIQAILDKHRKAEA